MRFDRNRALRNGLGGVFLCLVILGTQEVGDRLFQTIPPLSATQMDPPAMSQSSYTKSLLPDDDQSDMMSASLCSDVSQIPTKDGYENCLHVPSPVHDTGGSLPPNRVFHG